MAGAAVQRRLSWQAAHVVELIDETPRVRSVVFDVPRWSGHLAGQHLDIRLTAEDGYQAQRSYSVASAPSDDKRVTITVECLDAGEVSPYLAGELQVGDTVELRGPIGGYFVWEPAQGGPVLLVGGGSGVCPLMAMIRVRADTQSKVPARLLHSSRSFDDVIYREELARLDAAADGLQVHHTLTRSQPNGWSGYARRIDEEMLAEVAWPASEHPLIYVCGPTPLVESVAETLVGLGHEPARIKTERFGPTGGG